MGKNLHRTISKWAGCLAASTIAAAPGCALHTEAGEAESPAPNDDDGQPPEDTDPGDARARVEDSLDRLAALDTLDLGQLIGLQPGADGSPYTEPTDEDYAAIADRLEQFVALAESAALDIDAGDIASDFFTPSGDDSLCTRVADGVNCLTIAAHAENLERVNALQIVEVRDILRAQSEVSGFCYSSWEEVTDDECVRALKLEAIASAGEGME